MPTSVPIVFEELMDSTYWEALSEDDQRLSQWMRVVSVAIDFHHDSLEDIIKDVELEEQLLYLAKPLTEYLRSDRTTTISTKMN